MSVDWTEDKNQKGAYGCISFINTVYGINMVELEHLTFSYDGNREVLSDISFHLKQGESVGLIGANGAGKSTLLKILTGLLADYKGLVRIGGLDVNKKNLAAVRKKTGYVFQDSESQLFLSTIYEDVAFGPRNYGYSGEELEKRVSNALQQVHMEELKDRPIYRMSGGQKKLAAIATILAMEPEILLFDEPSVGLDPKNRRNLINIVNQIKGLKIIASHDLDMIFDTCEKTILIEKGKLIYEGKTAEILTDQKLLEESGLELPLSMQRRDGNRT